MNSWKSKDARNKILFTLMVIIVSRLGTLIPIPGVNTDYFKAIFESSSLGFINTITGGSLSSLSIFALNISPYISASIVIQLMSVIFPKLEELQKDGEVGKRKIKKYTYYITAALTIIESVAMIVGFGNKGLLTVGLSFISVAVAVVALVAGTGFITWLGEKVEKNGVGNGISIILAVNVVSSIPSDLIKLYTKFIAGRQITKGTFATIIIITIIIAMTVFVIKLNNAQINIPVQYAKKTQGRKLVGTEDSFIPLKINTAGVMPIIFASTIMQFPIVIVSMLNKNSISGTKALLLNILDQSKWFDFSSLESFKYTIGVVFYLGFILLFSYLYTAIVFNPVEVANDLKKAGGIITGIRPGQPTVEYLAKILKKTTLKGMMGVSIAVLVPIIISGAFKANVSCGGTSLIILVSVTEDTWKQLKALTLADCHSRFI